MRRKIDPVKHCETCKDQMHRKVMGGNGDLEGVRSFLRRKYCSQKCMGRAYRNDLESQLERNAEKVTESGCWIWHGGLHKDGYGIMKVAQKRKLVHRLTYELYRGAIPIGLEIDHLCRVRCCVNPAHLEVVEHHENVRRGNAGGPNSRKTHCPSGHPYDAENTYSPPGRIARACKICKRKR
jgi:hypothetical protein